MIERRLNHHRLDIVIRRESQDSGIHGQIRRRNRRGQRIQQQCFGGGYRLPLGHARTDALFLGTQSHDAAPYNLPGGMGADATHSAVGDPTMVAAARRVVEEAQASGVEVRLLGGIAIWIRSSQGTRQTLGREYADIDLVTSKKQAKGLREVLERLDYAPDKMFNATQGDTRLYYHSPDGAYHVDVFIEKFVMSHELNLAPRLTTEQMTLPAAELLLTKLQIAELNRKDASDTAMLLVDHELAETDGAGVLNVRQVTELCASDWGLYTTVTDNLEKTRSLLDGILADPEQRQQVETRTQTLTSELEAAPKSGGWRRRAKIGRRMRWYQTPDEADR